MMLFFTALPVKASENTDAISKTNTAVVESQDKQASLAAPELTATNLSGSIKVSWNKVSSADGYYIYRRTADGNWSDSPYKTISSNSTTSFEDESYKAGTDYYYRAVSYKKSNGKTVKSNYSAEDYQLALHKKAPLCKGGCQFVP